MNFKDLLTIVKLGYCGSMETLLEIYPPQILKGLSLMEICSKNFKSYYALSPDVSYIIKRGAASMDAAPRTFIMRPLFSQKHFLTAHSGLFGTKRPIYRQVCTIEVRFRLLGCYHR